MCEKIFPIRAKSREVWRAEQQYNFSVKTTLFLEVLSETYLRACVCVSVFDIRIFHPDPDYPGDPRPPCPPSSPERRPKRCPSFGQTSRTVPPSVRGRSRGIRVSVPYGLRFHTSAEFSNKGRTVPGSGSRKLRVHYVGMCVCVYKCIHYVSVCVC